MIIAINCLRWRTERIMNWLVYFAECAACLVIFTMAILIPLIKNPVWWIHDYPEDIQEKYFETHERIPVKPLSKPAIIKKGVAVLLCLVLLTGLMVIAGAHGFIPAFLAAYGLWLLVDWYDCFILDWVLFANLKSIQLPGTEHMDREYHQKKYHFIHSCIGMALGLIPCLLCGCLVELLF